MSELRTLIVIAAAAIAPAFFVGCNGDDGTSDDTDVEDTDAAEDTDDTDAAA